jgi:deoxyinosine 3'endonuclease (endonuclease V)
VGVGKKLYHVDGLTKGPEHKDKIETLLKKKGDYFHLIGLSGQIWGAAVRTSEGAINPVYVSVGHKISLDTAIKLVVACSVKRVPEPVRQVHTQTHTTCMTL